MTSLTKYSEEELIAFFRQEAIRCAEHIRQARAGTRRNFGSELNLEKYISYKEGLIEAYNWTTLVLESRRAGVNYV